MVRIIKISIYSLIAILIIGIVLTVIYSLNRYEVLDVSEKIELIEKDTAIRGGETSEEIILNQETNFDTEKERTGRVSDNSVLSAIEFLFASLVLNDVNHFSYSFNIEIILIEFQTFFDEEGKDMIRETMDKITRNNTIDYVEYVELRDNQIDLKITYTDEKVANVILSLEQAVSINYDNQPFFYQIMTSPLEIIEQIENTIQ